MKVLCVAFTSLFRRDELIFSNRQRYVREAARGAARQPSRFGCREMWHGRTRQEQPPQAGVRGCSGAVATSKRSYVLGESLS